jgi:tRNA threonylcarbamoyladenosine biosynthesis protein TsaB
MIVLGIDTSGYINAVGVCDGVRVLVDNRFPARTDTLEQIVDNIDVTLKQAGIALKDVEGIGVGLGPGSWTGIKVGVTVGKMLAFSADKPVVGIPTLEALAYSVRGESLPVYSVIGAGVKDMVYAAWYHFNENEPVRDGDYFAGDIRKLAEFIREPIVLAGPGALGYRGILLGKNEPVGDNHEASGGNSLGETYHNANKVAKNEPAGTVVTGDFSKMTIKALENEPAGASIACLAAMRLERGQRDNPLSLTPLYLKESTAKVFVNKYEGKKE